jgi:succinate dehydrogenase/fumarate reductase flavoprotein subunit
VAPSREAYQVVVVGSGGAGLRAAIAAREAGASVLVVTKGSTQYSGATASANFSYTAQFGYFGETDTAATYASDIERSGLGLADPALARRLAEDATPEAATLEGYGVGWRRERDGRHSLATFAGHTHPRAIHVGLRTGKVVVTALARAAERAGVVVWEYAFAVEVLKHGARAAGLLVYDIATGELVSIAAGAVVIATGGPVAMFDFHTNPDELTGDGHALAYAAGADLIDVEFIQHYPTVFVAPAAARGLHYPTGRLLGFGGRLLNVHREEFFARYSNAPLATATRDEVARAIALEVAAGRGTPSGGVFVDARDVPPGKIRDVHFEAYFHDIGLYVEREPQEVMAAPHYALGGIRIDADGRSTVPGLFAAGEVAGGVHGANRLTGSALPEVIVFGAAAGRAAAKEAAEPKKAPRAGDDAARLARDDAAEGGLSVGAAASRLRRALQSGAGVLKTADSLDEALQSVEAAERDLPSIRFRSPTKRFNWELVQFLELRCMARAGRLHALAARARRESRGAHQRLDFPNRDDGEWRARLAVRRGERGPVFEKVAAPA